MPKLADLRDLLLAAFQVEHKEHLESIRSILIKMEQGDGAVTSADRDEIFRCAHSLKAAARVCDFQPIEALGQKLEALFSQLRKGGRQPDRQVIEAIRAALNAIEDWALAVAEKRDQPALVHAMAALEHALEMRNQKKETPSNPKSEIRNPKSP